MLGTYASFLIVFGASAAVGQAIFVACGRRAWSALSPAVGLAALIALAWGTVRLPGEGVATIIAVGLAAACSLLVVRGRTEGGEEALRLALPVAGLALLAASLPFLVEGRFGILGTGLNPDMSQHLFAADRLAGGGVERLISDGYPLGPHALVVGLAALGPGPVQAFDGLTLAISVAACLAPLGLLAGLATWKRVTGALVIGLAYLVASSLVQGAFKETMQALFVLAFAIGLHEIARAWPAAGRPRLLFAVPLAALAIGSVYAYSFPGLAWLIGAALAWGAIELVIGARGESLHAALARARSALPAVGVAGAVLVVALAPEVGRLADFADFETFDPDGAGLGNLFNRLSPLEALGIWPSGDFRVEPGDGSVPAILFYLGGALGLGALAFGLLWWLRRGERAVPAAITAAAALWLYALIAGTPYQEAKALVLVAPLVALVSVRALLAGAPTLLAVGFLAAAGGSSALALVNGPVGPDEYSPALAELRPELGNASIVVRAPEELLNEEHGRDYLVWELRGNRICVETLGEEKFPGTQLLEVHDVGGGPIPDDYGAVRVGPGFALYPDFAAVARRLGDVPRGVTDDLQSRRRRCPFIPDGARADPAGDG